MELAIISLRWVKKRQIYYLKGVLRLCIIIGGWKVVR